MYEIEPENTDIGRRIARLAFAGDIDGLAEEARMLLDGLLRATTTRLAARSEGPFTVEARDWQGPHAGWYSIERGPLDYCLGYADGLSQRGTSARVVIGSLVIWPDAGEDTREEEGAA